MGFFSSIRMIDLIRMLMVSESSTIHCGFYIISVAFQHSKCFWMAFRRFSFHAESIALRQIANAKWIHWICMIHSIFMKLGSFYDSDGFALEMASISWIMLWKRIHIDSYSKKSKWLVALEHTHTNEKTILFKSQELKCRWTKLYKIHLSDSCGISITTSVNTIYFCVSATWYTLLCFHNCQLYFKPASINENVCFFVILTFIVWHYSFQQIDNCYECAVAFHKYIDLKYFNA